MKIELARKLRVADVVTRNPICATAEMSAREIGEMLDVNEISGAPVLDAADRLIGVVSKSDLMHRCVEELLDDTTETIWSLSACRRAWDPNEFGVVSDLMSPEPVTATMEETIGDVAGRMAERRVHRVVVVDEEDLVLGVLTTMDVIKALGEPRRRETRLKFPAIARGTRETRRLAA